MVPNVKNGPNPDSPVAKPKLHFCATMFQLPIPEHKLMIPPKSAMIFGEELYESVTLTVPNGQAWLVGLKKDGDHIWLHDGLHEFLDYYSVQLLYNLHFRYEGNSVFCVYICDASGSEIDYPCDGPSRGVKPNFGKHNEKSNRGDDSVEIWDIKPPISDNGLFVNHKEDRRGDECVEILDVKPSISPGSSQGNPLSGDVEQRSPSKRHDFLCQQKICRPSKRCRNAASMDSPLNGVACHTRSRMLEKERQVNLKELCNVNTSERGKAKENMKPHPPTLPVKDEGDVEMHVPKSLFYAKSRLVISKETEKAVHIAHMRKLENPSFMVILRPHNFSEKHVDLPTEFVKRHLSQCSEDMQLQVHNGECKWSVRCFYRSSKVKDGSRTMKKIGKGWRLFSSNNNLQVGDVCVFELLKKEKNNIMLRVWIYRAADYATRSKNALKKKK